MTCFAVYDTGVLLSALPSNHDDAAAVRVVDKITTGEIIPLVSQEILEQYRRELHEKRYHLSAQSIDYFLGVIEKYAMIVDPAATEDAALMGFHLPFYQVVMRKRESGEYSTTGNIRRLPRRPSVITVHDMLELMER